MSEGVPEKKSLSATPAGEKPAEIAGGSPAPPAAKTDWKKYIRSGAIVLVAAVAVIVVFQNSKDTTFEILFFDTTAPLWLLLLIHFLAGAAAALIGAHLWRKRRARPPAAK